MHSSIYRGRIRHRRFSKCRHEFTYPLFLMYLDLEELPELFQGRWCWSIERRTLARFCRADHLGDPVIPLADCVRQLVWERTGRRLQGPIRLLTHLRYFGYCFNPVSFYYCFDAQGKSVECVVAEVNNTPWGDRHCYVLDQPTTSPAGETTRYHSRKSMHVSPFMPMDLDYEWRLSAPHKRLAVFMSLVRDQTGTGEMGAKVFDASLLLESVPISTRSLAITLLRYPLMTVQVIAAIHWQAFRLWLKGVSVYPHPANLK
ncbi:MAG: DUF1365 domain-containing protein [Burkholderiaceae bacterium]